MGAGFELEPERGRGPERGPGPEPGRAATSTVRRLRRLRTLPDTSGALAVLEPVQLALLWAMLAATVGSGAQYVVKAARLLR